MSLVIKRIEDNVKKLYEAVSNGFRGDDAKQSAIDLGQALSDMSDKDIDYICSILFNPDNGLIKFLKRTGGNKDLGISTAVRDIILILVKFIEKRRKYPALQLFAVPIMKECNYIAKNGTAASRSASVELLTALLDKQNKFDTSEIDVVSCFKRYSDDYTLPKTQLPTGVKSKIIELLGKIARYYPEATRSVDFKRLKRWCFDNLEHQIKLQFDDIEALTVSGCLECLNSIMYCKNEDTVKPQSEDTERLLKILLVVLKKYQGTTRYQPPISALAMIKDHTLSFSNEFIVHWRSLFELLHYWATHHNANVYKYGLQAYEQYLRQLAKVLYHNIHGRQEYSIFVSLMNVFNEELKTADNLENFYKVSVSIRAVGYFAKVCHKALNPEQITSLRNSLVKISDWFYSDTNTQQRDYMRHLPAFIKAYTLFADEQTPISIELMEILHRMCNTYIMGYSNISGYHRRTGVYNIYSLFSVLHKKGEGVLRNFLNDFFEKALICTCTDVTTSDYDDERPAFNELLYFWKAILNKPYDSNYRPKIEEVKNETTVEDDENEDYLIELYRDDLVEPANLSDTLYDAFLLAVLKLTKTFNLKLKNVAEEADFTTGGEDEAKLSTVTNSLQPINQKDFILFQNLVEFWCLILKELDNRRLGQWVYLIGTAIIDQSVSNPLVSGFYRMMSELLSVCEKKQFFVGCKEYYSSSKTDIHHKKMVAPAEYSTFLVFREYLKEVWHRLQQFTDEILASCLRLILSYPIAFFDLAELVAPLEKALKLGITYHPLATIAMNSLDKLLDPNLGYDINSGFLSRILPCINEYLLVGVVNDTTQGTTINKKKYRIPTAAQRKYQSVHIKMSSDQMGIAKSDYSALPELQLRMMQFLGRLSGKNKQLLSQGNDSIQNNDMLAWDPVKRLKLRVPFRNSRVDVYLDEFLPRICELAESAPDRQVKVAACELLHGLSLFMIGSAAFQARDTRAASESDFHKLYLHIFPVMLRLAIDPDQIARDMYRTLFSQIIHWLTNNAHYENPETIALLQACLEAACNNDAGLRDYGAECIQEFVKWSIKQTSRSTDGATNISSLLKRLYNLMSNPSPNKRFGASLVFNRIYRLFREESVLVRKFTFEILGQLFLSLKIAEVDHPSIGTRDQIIEAISHIKRIIREKASIFLAADTDRKPFIGSDDVVDLPSVVEWAFTESGKPQRTYAKVCMNFFNEFVLHIPGIKSANDWLSKATERDHNYYIDRFETNISHTPSPMEDKDKLLTTYTNWIKGLNSSMDSYIWLIERKVLDPDELLHNLNSMFVIALSYFIKNSPNDVLEERLVQSVLERTKLNSIYTHISVRMVYFFDLIFKSQKYGAQCYNYINRLSADILYHDNFIKMVTRTLLLPKLISETIQLDLDNAVTNSGVNRIYKVANDFIGTMKSKQSSTFLDALSSSVSQTIQDENVNILLTSESNMERSSLIEITQTIDGLKMLQSLGLFDSICQNLNNLNQSVPSTEEEYCLALFNQYLRLCQVTEDPLLIQLLGRSVMISFSHSGFSDRYARDLLGLSGSLQRLSNAVKLDIYQKYSEYIFECIACHFQEFSVVFVTELQQPLVRNYISMFLMYMKQNRLSQRKLVFKFTDNLVQNPNLLETLITYSTTNEELLELVDCLKSLFGADPGIMSRSKKKPIFTLLWNAFMKLLERKHSFAVKNATLDLLPVYISLNEKKEIMEKLRESIVQDLPPETDNIGKGTALYNEYTSYLDKLLDTMSTFKSTDIFNLLIGHFVQEEHHIHEEAIKRSVEKFTTGLGEKKFMEVVEYCYKEFKNEHHSILQRHNLVELIISLLTGVDDNAVVKFYESHIVDIMCVIQRETVSNTFKQVADWSEKADCFRLIQALFDRLPTNALIEPTNSIAQAWMNSSKNSTGKKLENTIIMGPFSALRKTPILPKSANDNSRREAQFLYNRSVFNAVAAILLCVGKSENQLKILFITDRAYNTYNWEYIFDTTEEIKLRLELDKPLVKSKLNELRAASGYSERDRQNIAYMASVALTGSSFTQSSLSDMVLEENREESDQSRRDVPTPSSTDIDVEMSEASSSLENEIEGADEFEVDILNANPCMKPLTELIKKLHEEVCPPSNAPSNIPVWVKELLNAFNKSDNTDLINIQLYIAKLIINYSFAFENYASHWLLPLMKLVVKGASYGDPINYLVQDICVILIVWGKTVELPSSGSHETRRILYDFLEYLIKHAYHEQQRIMRSNIQIIKGVFENWGKYIPVPTPAIYEQFTHTGEEQYKNIVGLQIMSIVFLNGGNPYDNNEFILLDDLSEILFYTDMASNVAYKKGKKREMSADAAELMGMSIHFMRENNNYNLHNIQQIYLKMLRDLSNSVNHSSLQFLKCMNRLYLRDVELAKELLPSVTLRLNQYGTGEKVLAMNCIGACWNGDDMIYYTLQQAGLERMISNRDENMQVAALTVLNKIFEILEADQINWVTDRISRSFVDHENENCRTLYYEFLKKAIQSDRISDTQFKSELKMHIFKGLIDKNKNLSQDIFLFIEHVFDINDDINLTLRKVTREMYMPDTEDIYLLYATCMILNNTKKSFDFDKPIFDRPLPNARFDADYQHINTSWQNTSSMLPLFRASQAKTLNAEELELELRRTQTLLDFSATQGTSRSLLATFNPDTEEKSGYSVDGPPSAESEKAQVKKEAKKNPYYRRRFVETPRGATNRFHSDRNERLEKKMRNLQNTYKEISEKRVNLSRSYRIGELPDVQINFKDLLLPLEVLASADYNISRLLYSGLVVGIIKANKNDSSGYQNDIIRDIQKNMKESVLNFTPTIGSFLRIFYELNVTEQPEYFIRNASSKSFNHHIGIALLEKQLEICSAPQHSGKRRHNVTHADDTVLLSPADIQKRKSQWIDLSLLYKDIDEPEIFQNLYLTNVAEKELPKIAINAEIRGDYVEAFNCFKQALIGHPEDPYECSLWEEQMMNCYTQLTQWGDIANMVLNVTHGDPLHHIWEPETKDQYLDYYIRSFSKFEMRMNGNNQITEFFEEAAKNEAHKDYLLKNYACDWSAVAIYNRKYDQGLQIIKSSYDSLLAAWTTLHPLAYTSRLARLGQLERTVEIEDYLKLIKKVEQNVITANKIDDFFKSLTMRYPDERTDTIDIWDEIIDSRSAFLNDLIGRSEIVQKELPEIDQYLVKYLSAMTEAAIKQNNMKALTKLSKKFEGIKAEYETDLIDLRLCQMMALKLDLNAPKKSKFMLNTIMRALSLDPSRCTDKDEVLQSYLLLAQSFDIVKQQLILSPNLFDEMAESDKLKRSFRKNAGVLENAETFTHFLEVTGYNTLIKASKKVDRESKLYAENLWKLGSYCNRSLRILQDATSTLQLEIDPVKYSTYVIQYYFEAIGRGHTDAWENFPRLLELIDLYPECGPVFEKCSSELDESWRYIKWIPQLVSFTESSTAKYIFPTLLRIAEDYPRALYYPFQMSFEYYELKKDKIPLENRVMIEKILAMIRSDVAMNFTFELQRLTDPDLLIKDFIDFTKTMLCNKDVPEEFAATIYDRFKRLALNVYKEELGTFHKSFATKHAHAIGGILGKEGVKLHNFTNEDVKAFFKYYSTKIAGTFNKNAAQPGRDKLKSYSNWLFSFKSSQQDEELEIPGQYTGLSKPYPEFHAKVATLDNNILCMSSIRRPKRIKIYGSDEKEYLFLVKGGEDLRLDERIEQLFGVMNNMLKKNAFCSKQNISIATYKVIPMSSNLGLIEWVSSTKPLKNCIEERMPTRVAASRMNNKYQEWIAKHRPNSKERHAEFHKSFADTRDNIEQAFNAVTEMVPSTLLRDFVLSLSASPEAFLFLRKYFAFSVASISIFGYILGIGDRHLENFLLDMKSGRLIPIDFGHAFGSATELLPIPELVPFRLTRQIVGVMEPLGISGLLENAMVNVLKAIQDEKELLLNIMDVFVKDPLLDWTKAATDLAKNQKNEDRSAQGLAEDFPTQEDIIEWYPQKKLDIVKRKLNGDNPADILSTELTHGHRGKPYYKSAIELAKGSHGHNIRASVKETCKDANEQVKCLIDLATDNAVLGVAWSGWQSFL